MHEVRASTDFAYTTSTTNAWRLTHPWVHATGKLRLEVRREAAVKNVHANFPTAASVAIKNRAWHVRGPRDFAYFSSVDRPE